MAKGNKGRTKQQQRSVAVFSGDNVIVRYLKETRAEMAKVTWPTRDEALRLTGIVLAVTVGMAVFLGLVDALFATLFRFIMGA